MIACPPTSPLFPYTTLFRSGREIHIVDSESASMGEGMLAELGVAMAAGGASAAEIVTALENRRRDLQVYLRSEEHTSELQSLRHLVCRLLLEKKNKI